MEQGEKEVLDILRSPYQLGTPPPGFSWTEGQSSIIWGFLFFTVLTYTRAG
jgi:hypothetical protein